MIAEELRQIEKEVGSDQFGRVPHEKAARLFEEIIAAPEFEEFLTLKAYAYID